VIPPRKLNKLQLRVITSAKDFTTSEEFQQNDPVMYQLAKDTKLLRLIFPSESQIKVYAVTTPTTEFMSTTMSSSLENLIDMYLTVPYAKGEHRKIALPKLITNLREILDKEY